MDLVSVDFFEYAGRNYLLMVDRFSFFPWVKLMKSTTTDATTTVLDSWFMDWGFPRRIRSDNGPQFRALFKMYCNDRRILHETSSPYHAASNGNAEAAVKQVKVLLKKCLDTGENFAQALLEWRNTARQSDGLSPAQAFLGRQQRTLLPCMNISNFNVTYDKVAQARRAAGAVHAAAFDQHARDLPQLQVGDRVLLQDPHSKDWAEEGVITAQHEFNRSYDVETNGTIKRRNRKFLKPLLA